MKRNFRPVVLSIFLFLALIMSVTTIFTLISTASAAEIPESVSTEFYLKLENGEISVYKNGETIKTGISVPELRDSDRIMLEEGIYVNSYEDILKLIEDFNS